MCVISNRSVNSNGFGNSILADGPNSIQPLFQILIKFRSYKKVCIWDLSKAYNRIVIGKEELNMRRLVWRWGKEDICPDTADQMEKGYLDNGNCLGRTDFPSSGANPGPS